MSDGALWNAYREQFGNKGNISKSQCEIIGQVIANGGVALIEQVQNENITNREKELHEDLSELNDLREKVEHARKETTISNIQSQEKRDAINMFTNALKAAKEVLGEERFTENVLIKLLETASYMTWRSLPEQEKKR